MAADGQLGHPSMFQVTSNAKVSRSDSGIRGVFLNELNCFPSYMDCTEMCEDCNEV